MCISFAFVLNETLLYPQASILGPDCLRGVSLPPNHRQGRRAQLPPTTLFCYCPNLGSALDGLLVAFSLQLVFSPAVQAYFSLGHLDCLFPLYFVLPAISNFRISTIGCLETSSSWILVIFSPETCCHLGPQFQSMLDLVSIWSHDLCLSWPYSFLLMHVSFFINLLLSGCSFSTISW